MDLLRRLILWPIVLTALHAQEAEPVIRTNTRVVEIDVSVRDAEGGRVDGLTKDDFTIIDNRKQRPFTIFSADSAGPVTESRPADHSTIILLDAVNGWSENFAVSRNASIGMLKKVPADDRIAIYVIDKHNGLEILQDYTLDRGRLLSALQKFIPQWMCPAPMGGLPSSCQGSGNMRSAFEAVQDSLKALARDLAAQPGRKGVFWVTQGFPDVLLRRNRSWNDVVSALNDANVVVNALDSNGLWGPPPIWGVKSPNSLIELAEATGGKAYYNRNDFDTALAEGIVNSRSNYTLGFYVSETDGDYHTLKVNVDRPHLQLSYRLGYYAVDQAKQIGITANLALHAESLDVQLKVSPEALSLRTSNAGRSGRVKETFMELNVNDRVVKEFSGTAKFDIAADKERSFASSGITLEQALALAPGAVKLRIVVEDAESGRAGTVTIPIGGGR